MKQPALPALRRAARSRSPCRKQAAGTAPSTWPASTTTAPTSGAAGSGWRAATGSRPPTATASTRPPDSRRRWPSGLPTPCATASSTPRSRPSPAGDGPPGRSRTVSHAALDAPAGARRTSASWPRTRRFRFGCHSEPALLHPLLRRRQHRAHPGRRPAARRAAWASRTTEFLGPARPASRSPRTSSFPSSCCKMGEEPKQALLLRRARRAAPSTRTGPGPAACTPWAWPCPRRAPASSRSRSTSSSRTTSARATASRADVERRRVARATRASRSARSSRAGFREIVSHPWFIGGRQARPASGWRCSSPPATTWTSSAASSSSRPSSSASSWSRDAGRAAARGRRRRCCASPSAGCASPCSASRS